MKLLVNGQYLQDANGVIEFDKAVKNIDSIALYKNNNSIGTFAGVSDMNIFELEGGEWSEPELDIWTQLRLAYAEGVNSI